MRLHLYTTRYQGNIRTMEETELPLEPDGGREEQVINLYPQITYQTVDGFGGAITDSAAYIYSLMAPEQKKQLLEEYFGRDKMKYRFVRIPIDSCDFSLEHYEADSDETDELLEKFSFDRTEKYILPMLRDAEQVYGGKLDIMLSPWSPPAYMKTNGERNHGGKLKDCYRQRWAEYICRYIHEFRSRGFHVTMLTLQNEPKAVQTWDSCTYTAEEEKDFLLHFVWPTLVRWGMDDMKIYIWDHNKERAYEWAEAIIDEPTTHILAGVAFHWYSGDHFEVLRMIREQFPGKELILSEACIEFSRYSPEDNLVNAEKYAHDLIGNLNEGMCTFLDWNLVLDEKGGPNHVGNFCDAPFLYNTAEKQLEPREIQVYLRHFSHFIDSGMERIGLSRYTNKLEATAFQNSDKIVFVILNQTDEEIPAYVRIQDTCAKVMMKPHSICSGEIVL